MSYPSSLTKVHCQSVVKGELMSGLGLKDYPDLITQAECLADYIGRHGYILEKDPAKAADRVNAFHALNELIKQAQKSQDVTPDLECDLREAYQKLTAFTFPETGINGLTVWQSAQTRIRPDGLDTAAKKLRHRITRMFLPFNLPLLMGMLILVGLFAIIIGTNYAGCTADGVGDPKSWLWLCSLDQYLIPMGWGAIGTTVYVLKRTTDARNNETYSRFRLAGYSTRVFLGAMFGMIVVDIFITLDAQNNHLDKLSVAAVAFVAGLGIKPVYAAFEQIAIQLSDRITGKKTPTT
jgi:hypothetical protein